MRAQASYISVILIFGITLALMSAVYVWGNPIIQRSKAATTYEYSISKLAEIRSAISAVSKAEGSQYKVPIDLTDLQVLILEGPYLNGTEIGNNSIEFKLAQSSEIAQSWALVDPEENDMSPTGNLSSDTSGVIIGKSDGATTEFRLWYRNLYDNHTGTNYTIEIVQGINPAATGGRHNILLKNNGTSVSGSTVTTRIIAGVD
jgi:hypothetical protein